jgi:ribosomal protein L11 methyltransferase
MDTVSVKLALSEAGVAAELLVYMLGELGYEGFLEEDNLLEAFVKAELYSQSKLDELLALEDFKNVHLLTVQQHADQNWNALWEESYDDVIIGQRCRVRAPFHPVRPDIEFDLLIEPRMSFGTAHHETTHMMIELLLDSEIAEKSLLDMGCGTAVLAILGRKLGACPVVAIDNDEWAVNNAKDNILLNETKDINIVFGDASKLSLYKTDILVANINRNILLADLPVYDTVLNHGGLLFLSGFYEDDLSSITEQCFSLGLINGNVITRNKWCAAVFHKP